MYMFPLSHDIYAAVPQRVWWAPWRWSLGVIYWRSPADFAPLRTIATNLTKAECIGLIKLLGYPHEIR
jgi:hypothetical protein